MLKQKSNEAKYNSVFKFWVEKNIFSEIENQIKQKRIKSNNFVFKLPKTDYMNSFDRVGGSLELLTEYLNSEGFTMVQLRGLSDNHEDTFFKVSW